MALLLSKDSLVCIFMVASRPSLAVVSIWACSAHDGEGHCVGAIHFTLA